MLIPTSILALSQLLVSSLTSQLQPHPLSSLSSSSTLSFQSTSIEANWIGDLPNPGSPGSSDPESNIRLGASVSACTFALGPPGPPSTALCSAFISYCTTFRDDMRSRHISQLKSQPLLSPIRRESRKRDDDEGNPLKHIKFRAGCVGGSGTASDASYISGYTATCIVDGTDWVPYVFDSFIRAEFGTGEQDGPLPIYSSFIGCQVPAHL